jgi:predicted MPP superfamily phosphohydrolase
MQISLVHLSDLHFRLNWYEDQGLVLDAFFIDLAKQIKSLEASEIYIAFSGDFVFAGSDNELYKAFFNYFDTELNKLKIARDHRICVPGNHDVSQLFIQAKNIEHEGILFQKLPEKEFNDYLTNNPNLLIGKFDEYLSFQTMFARYGLTNEKITGAGWDIVDNISIFCLNSALCSVGGFGTISDKERLSIDTRSLQKWTLENKSKSKILLMHHPISWLSEWSQSEIKTLLHSKYSLCLSGHVHDQSTFHTIHNDSELVECVSPPLFTNKRGDLGYTIITVTDNGVSTIQYRQWTKYNTFVTGVSFSNTDDGKIIIRHQEPQRISGSIDHIGSILDKRFTDALCSFSSQPIVWAEPILSKTNELSRNIDASADVFVSPSELALNPKSTIIKAPPQFGLTCLAHYLTKTAWQLNKSPWLYLDCKRIKGLKYEKELEDELKNLGVDIQRIRCILLDSWSNLEKDSLKLLKLLSESFEGIPLIVMQTIDESTFFNESSDEIIHRAFDVLYLLALPRGHIRKVVSAYNVEKHIGDDDAVLSKVVMDMEVLNIPRTPLNCLTLLKVAEKYFDESPVNRTKMLEMVLFVLFNLDGIPTYKSKPDLKDCEYVLGRFCENMIRSGKHYFSREDFIKDLRAFCADKMIDLEVDVVFDVLYSNHIIVKRDSIYVFRFTYWIHYFAAQRMHQSQDFAKFIFDNKRYVSYPEMIEFYTGIDRRREDALKILTDDLKATCDTVRQKVGLPQGMNPYRLINWDPTPEELEKIRSEISENVLNSNLPDDVKDQHADQFYDQTRPYNQSIHTVFHEYSVLVLIQSIKAASRALRNSDYANPEIKREMLKEIILSWEQVSNVLLALSPLLAQKGNAKFEGANFLLFGDFGQSFDDRIKKIIENIPYNVVSWYKNDIFSHKMGPLLFDAVANETQGIRKHEMILLLINERPRDWKSQVEHYIASIPKSSFYLFDLVSSLCNQYCYSFASHNTLMEIEYLIKMGLAKHELGRNWPGLDSIRKISNSVLPKRQVDDSDKTD